MIGQINNGDQGVVVRGKLNEAIDIANIALSEDTANIKIGLPDPDTNGKINLNGKYLVTGTVNIGNNEIVLQGDTQLIGFTASADLILYNGTGSMISGNGYGFVARYIAISSPNGSVFDITGTADKVVYMQTVVFNNCDSIGTISTYNIASIQSSQIVGCGSITFDGAMGVANVNGCVFESATDTEIVTTSGFTGGSEIRDNWFKDSGGGYIQYFNFDGKPGLIRGNRFGNVDFRTVSNFVGFDKGTVGVIVQDNVNQADSDILVDGYFIGNTTVETVTTAWKDINPTYTIAHNERVEYNLAGNYFEYTGSRVVENDIRFNIYSEAQSNNTTFEFAIHVDRNDGNGFTLENGFFPFRFRSADTTQMILLESRIEMHPNDKFKLRVRRPSGSANSNILFLSGKAVI